VRLLYTHTTRIEYCLLLAALAATLSCNTSDPLKADPPSLSGIAAPAPSFTNLTDKDDVLVNLELAYQTGNSSEFSRLLDVSFVYHFSEKDVVLGDVLTDEWDRSLERIAFSYMFAEPVPTGIPGSSTSGGRTTVSQAFEERTWGYIKNYFFVSPWDSVETLTLDLLYVEGDGQWVPFVDPGSGETWYRKGAQYELTVETGRGKQFECLDGEASFVVRERPGGGVWQLVEWDDIKPWYKDLQEKDDVLVNLEMAYDNLSFSEIDRLLDDNFVFFFSDYDFGSGNTPAQWDRVSELSATANMFSGVSPPGPDPIIAIDVSLTYPPGGWTAFTPPGFPTETWYQKMVRYDFVVEAPPITYLTLNVDMMVQIRYADVGGESGWHLVTWLDFFGSLERSWQTLPSAVPQEFSWGHLKALYSD
jgi:hypothetical protein